MVKIFIRKFFSCVNDYADNVATFTALAKIKLIFLQYKGSRAQQNFLQQDFSAQEYIVPYSLGNLLHTRKTEL